MIRQRLQERQPPTEHGARADVRVEVLGVGISAIDPDMALDRIERWIETRSQHYVCVTGVHGVMESQRDSNLRRIHNASGLTTPDGMPMVWAGLYAGASWIRRVYGPDLVKALAAKAAERGWRVFLFGGRPGVPELLSERLCEQHPGLRIVGTLSPSFSELSAGEERDIDLYLDRAQPDIVLVGLGTPKQERWMAARMGRIEAPVLIGVGAAFDLLTGLVPQAPRWLQRSGLEWLYRLMQEPRRLGPRYVRANPAFIYKVLRHRPCLRLEEGLSA